MLAAVAFTETDGFSMSCLQNDDFQIQYNPCQYMNKEKHLKSGSTCELIDGICKQAENQGGDLM